MPTVEINGRRLEGAFEPPELFEILVDLEERGGAWFADSQAVQSAKVDTTTACSSRVNVTMRRSRSERSGRKVKGMETPAKHRVSRVPAGSGPKR